MATFDFIIVGAGAAGCALASRLANSLAAPSVLLLEAGNDDPNPSLDKTMLVNRMNTLVTHPELNWGYETEPQKYLADRKINYSRGKGVGGSTLINFCFWTVGSRDDYDEWARMVGDDSFNWENMQRRLKKIENYRSNTDPELAKFVKPDMRNHGTGVLDVEIPDVMEPEIMSWFNTLANAGGKINLDGNSGDPLGVAVGIATGKKSIRSNAKTAYLQNTPENLTILAQSLVSKILFEDQTAVGVESNGVQYRASKEVIISAGALDTPKLFMLSGIGDPEELGKHNIPVLHNLPGVGKNLQDHPFAFALYQRTPPPTQSYAAWETNSDAAKAAQEQLLKDGSGPLAMNGLSVMLGFHKDAETLESEEFRQLPLRVQEHLNRPTVPTYEQVWGLSTSPLLDLSKSHLMCPFILMNPQSTGSVTLASSNPSDKVICDPALFSHPFDRLAFISAIRQTMNTPGNPALTDIELTMTAPAALDDDSIWSWVQQNCNTAWHMSCTVKMGPSDDPMACVDNNFRVKGMKKLRVVDMSVTPFLPNCHTVSVAYLIGETAAEKLIAEYGLLA